MFYMFIATGSWKKITCTVSIICTVITSHLIPNNPHFWFNALIEISIRQCQIQRISVLFKLLKFLKITEFVKEIVVELQTSKRNCSRAQSSKKTVINSFMLLLIIKIKSFCVSTSIHYLIAIRAVPKPFHSFSNNARVRNSSPSRLASTTDCTKPLKHFCAVYSMNLQIKF